MDFRDNKRLKPVVIIATSPKGLEKKLVSISKKGSFIDLQFSTTTRSGDGIVEYSALALISERKRK